MPGWIWAHCLDKHPFPVCKGLLVPALAFVTSAVSNSKQGKPWRHPGCSLCRGSGTKHPTQIHGQVPAPEGPRGTVESLKAGKTLQVHRDKIPPALTRVPKGHKALNLSRDGNSTLGSAAWAGARGQRESTTVNFKESLEHLLHN